ncbi:MAG: SAM-dependent methyltransferase [Aurantimonas endophytica]|uniref:SAM-dependent MidA family methyltransferase n=1 Tax=Aurantimonas endophytica TaxID=1522175 RepID=A0A7W6HC12_9HYPH|nr:SAM-dependent MidA family methyltransferase [Aurantimonas endophytica]MCO6401988.1 class I SAM-dependent methyltransferase [Aurantimonas endophytica]
MNPLARKIAATIEAEGPIGLDRYWNIALFDREHGYYTSREPFGRTGDFITAPEVSQMFGELIGAWVVASWRALGAPTPFLLAEIGPGRGTLMADMLRTIARIAPNCMRAVTVRLVETSDRLAAVQVATLERFDLPIRRLRQIRELEATPAIIIANELFDAIAMRQFVFDGEAWRERCVAISGSGRFEFVLTRRANDLPEVRVAGASPLAGAVLEWSPAREALAAELAERLARNGGAGLFIDYGHAATGFGDTLQAVHGHAFADPLDRPGECDITSHVDFAPIAAAFRDRGLAVSPVATQGAFLLSLGLRERAEALGAPADAENRATIEAAMRRLAGPEKGEMGRLFKVLCASAELFPLPPFGLDAAD